MPETYRLERSRKVSTQGFMQALLSDARSYVTKTFGVPADSFPDDAVRHAVDGTYDGGWSAYEADFRRFYDTTEVRTKTETMTPVKLRAAVVHWTGKRLSAYDEVINFDDGDDTVKVVVSRATVEYRSRRDVITARSLELWVFTRPEGYDGPASRWTFKRDFIAVDDTETSRAAFVRWGAVNDELRHADKMDQFDTCYRPGTAKTPMQGWVARAEASWKDMHADEDFQGV